MRHRIELSEDVTRQFKILYESGVSLSTVATRLNEMFPGLGLTRHTSSDLAAQLGLQQRFTSEDSLWNNKDVVAEFKRLHAENLSHGIIAAMLNTKFGLHLSRSACIGRASRMRLTRPKIVNVREAVAKGLWKEKKNISGVVRRKSGRKTVNGKVGILEDIRVPEGEGISIDQLLPFALNASTSCRYPLGKSEAHGTMYCGEPTHRGSWCEYHCEVVFKGGRYVAPEPVNPAAGRPANYESRHQR